MSTLQASPGKAIAMLTLQRDLYLQLRELAGQQRALISADAPELLLSLLTERQTIVSRLARLNEELAPLRRNWDATLAALPVTERDALTALLAEINSLLRSILATDESDGSLLVARKQQTGQELQTLSGRHTAARAYAEQASAGLRSGART